MSSKAVRLADFGLAKAVEAPSCRALGEEGFKGRYYRIVRIGFLFMGSFRRIFRGTIVGFYDIGAQKNFNTSVFWDSLL